MTQFRRESCCEPGASLEKRVGVDSGIGEVAGLGGMVMRSSLSTKCHRYFTNRHTVLFRPPPHRCCNQSAMKNASPTKNGAAMAT
jgi:hypothetical protein